MYKPNRLHPATSTAIQLLLIFIWIYNLQPTDAHHSVYLLCGLVGAFCLTQNPLQQALSKATYLCLMGFSVLFSGAVVMANYPLFLPVTPVSLVQAASTGLGGMVIGWSILLKMMDRKAVDVSDDRRHPGLVFAVVFVTITAIDLLFLKYAVYPGILTRDTFHSLKQIITGNYNNTSPFYYTLTIEVFFQLGMWLFGDINKAVALFSFAQILFMAACFAYVVTTMYQAYVPKFWLVVFFAGYALLYYNIAYSVTMWKDIPFSAAALLIVTSLYRYLRHIGKSQKGNMVIFILGAVTFSFWRTNGWYAFLALTLILLLTARKQHKTLLKVMAIVLAVCWIFISPMLDILDVASTDMTEAFSIPMQQIARAASDELTFTEEETLLLEQAFKMDILGDMYVPWLADPVKFDALRRDNVDYLEEHFGEYVQMYLRMALRYPGPFIKAWIEQTKGYWNGGYDYWVITTTLFENEYGIQRTADGSITYWFEDLSYDFMDQPLLQPLSSIGLQVWILIACCVVNCCKKRQEFLLSIPLLVIVVGLWLGTPVFAEFRYAYPFFITTPLIFTATMFPVDEDTSIP